MFYEIRQKTISERATKINHFQVATTGGKKVLQRKGIGVTTVSLQECLRSFCEFLKTTADEIRKSTSKN